ncbi:hypothetical protein [Puia sp.]|jgi:hypothetical protein|uniref:hypothetical protein n=1 Tax=Puia sp. TaxID=2045100 RepID=UPI002F40F73D
MSNESNEIPSERTPDAFAAWRHKLAQPEALPEQGLTDKDAAWDKLFERLGEKPPRPLFGYRAVAACILILLIPAARLFQDRTTGGKDRPVAEKMRPAPMQATPGVLPTRQGPAPLPPAKMLKPRTRPAAAPAPTTPGQPATIAPGQLATITLQPATITAQPASVAPPPVTARPSKPAPKKQWKVVDWNELDPGGPRPHQMAANRQPSLLRIGLGLGNTGPGESTSSSREDESRLKLNLTTQNR